MRRLFEKKTEVSTSRLTARQEDSLEAAPPAPLVKVEAAPVAPLATVEASDCAPLAREVPTLSAPEAISMRANRTALTSATSEEHRGKGAEETHECRRIQRPRRWS